MAQFSKEKKKLIGCAVIVDISILEQALLSSALLANILNLILKLKLTIINIMKNNIFSKGAISLSVALFLSLQVNAQQETKLLRFPDIHDNNVVFTYAGDLYIADITDGHAKKLTNDPDGFESFARFSNDGSMIAFTGQYDGNTEVYLMPVEGGEPKRLTHTATLSRDDVSDRMGPNNIVMTWSPDGKNVIYRSRKQTFNDFTGQLFSVSVDGGMSTELPLAVGSWCSYSPDGSKMAMNRVFREFRTWKYYKGGMADDIWVFDNNDGSSYRITETDAQVIFSIW